MARLYFLLGIIILLLNFLKTTSQSKIKYIFITSILVFIFSCLLGLTLNFVFHETFNDPETISPDYGKGFQLFFLLVVFAPIFETTLMIPILFLIGKFVCNTIKVSLISAILWAVIHSIFVPLHGIFVIFSFFVYSVAFKEWDKISRKYAFLIVMAIHALHNFYVFIGMLVFPDA